MCFFFICMSGPADWPCMTSHADYKALPEFDWYQVFNMAGYVLPPKPPSKAEARAARNAAWVAEQEAAKKQRMEGVSSASSCSK